MPYDLSFLRKQALTKHWPARLDAELRARFGDAVAPKTAFNADLRQYTTTFTPVDDGVLNAQIVAYAEGYQTAISWMVE